jgi:hypothetical protein
MRHERFVADRIQAAAKLLTKDEAPRIAANIAKLAERARVAFFLAACRQGGAD